MWKSEKTLLLTPSLASTLSALSSLLLKQASMRALLTEPQNPAGNSQCGSQQLGDARGEEGVGALGAWAAGGG